MNLSCRTGALGPCMMALASLFFALTSLFVRLGANQGVPVGVIVLARFFFMFLVMESLRVSGKIRVRPHNKTFLFWRSVMASVGGVFYFYAMASIPIAEAVVLKYTYPLFGVAIAAFAFGEKAGRIVLAALALSLAGIFIMVNPVFFTLHPGHLWGLLNGLSAGIAVALLRQLRATDDSSTVLYFHSLAGVAVSLPLLTQGLSLPGFPGGVYVIFAAMFGMLGQLSIVYGFRYIKTGSGSVVMGLEVVFSALVALIFLGQIPGVWKVIGGTMIVVGAALVSGRERIRSADIREDGNPGE